MACGKCGGYYCCKCDLLKVKNKIKIKKLELVDLELEKIKLQEKHAKSGIDVESDEYMEAVHLIAESLQEGNGLMPL